MNPSYGFEYEKQHFVKMERMKKMTKKDILPRLQKTMMNDKLLFDTSRKLIERADIISNITHTEYDIYYDIADCFYDWCVAELPIFCEWNDDQKKHFKKRVERRIRYFHLLTDGIMMTINRIPQEELCQDMFIKAVLYNESLRQKIESIDFIKAQFPEIPEVVATIISHHASFPTSVL